MFFIKNGRLLCDDQDLVGSQIQKIQGAESWVRKASEDLRSLLRDVEGRELEDSEIAWVLRLALRKQDGPAGDFFRFFLLCGCFGTLGTLGTLGVVLEAWPFW